MYIQETKEIINYLLDNNLELIKNGQHKIAIGLEGSPGIGKTAIIKEIAEERNAKFVRVELSSMEEIGDLIGIPIKEFVMISPDGEELWVTEKLIDEYVSSGYKFCANCSPRMSYAIPSWVPTNPDEEVILLLDDYTRATSLFMQAIMSLIQFGEYISWKLPEKTHLILTSNEDNGSMNVTSLDSAQSSRLLNFHLDFNCEQYGKWMDKCKLKSEAINFMLLNQDIFDQSERINARTYTMFANAISGFKDFNDPNVLYNVDLIAKGCFGNDTTIGDLFVAFVHNKLDKLISPEDILKSEWENVQNKLIENIYKNGEYQPSIASIITIRFINYLDTYFSLSLDKNKSEKVIDRIIDICTKSSKTLLTEDLIYKMIKTLNAKYPARCSKLFKYPEIRTKILQ